MKRGGLGEGPEYRDVVRTGRTSGAEADFPENHHRAQGPFGVIVGRWSVMDDEGEDLLIFAGFGKEPFAQGFGFWIGLRMFANAVETDEELCGERLACLDGWGNGVTGMDGVSPRFYNFRY